MKDKNIGVKIIIFSIILLPSLIISICLGFFTEDSFWESFFSGLLVTAVQFILITFFLEIYIKKDATQQQIKSLAEDIDFSRNYKNEVVSQTILLSIKKLNALKVTKIDMNNCCLIQESYKGTINLLGSNITGLVMRDCEFQNACFRQCKGDGASFELSKLCNCDFSYTIISNANFQSCNLLNANFENAILSGANFKKAVLKDVSFANSVLDNSDFTGAMMLQADQFFSVKSSKNVKMDEALLEKIRAKNSAFGQTL